jgi:hypothetical protein
MAIKAFDKQNLKVIRQDINAALASVEKKHGIKLGLENISFSPDNFRGKLQAYIPNASGVEVAGNIKWQTQFKQHAAFYGLSVDDLGKDFEYSGTKYKIVGAMSEKARGQEIIVQKEGSDKFQRMDAEIVKLKLGK